MEPLRLSTLFRRCVHVLGGRSQAVRIWIWMPADYIRSVDAYSVSNREVLMGVGARAQAAKRTLLGLGFLIIFRESMLPPCSGQLSKHALLFRCASREGVLLTRGISPAFSAGLTLSARRQIQFLILAGGFFQNSWLSIREFCLPGRAQLQHELNYRLWHSPSIMPLSSSDILHVLTEVGLALDDGQVPSWPSFFPPG